MSETYSSYYCKHKLKAIAVALIFVQLNDSSKCDCNRKAHGKKVKKILILMTQTLVTFLIIIVSYRSCSNEKQIILIALNSIFSFGLCANAHDDYMKFISIFSVTING